MADRIREVILEITPDHHIARIQFEEADESVTEYRFSQQQENRRDCRPAVQICAAARG